MNNDQIKYTKTWWNAICADPVRLGNWLLKLEETEFSGYVDHHQFIEMYQEDITPRTKKILVNIADDEFKHSELLQQIIIDRDFRCVDETLIKPSSYWEYMNQQVKTVEDYCAVNYYGEALASERFEIILHEQCTPMDLRSALTRILPDEIFHRETLLRIAGDEALAKMKAHHEIAFSNLIKK